MTFCKCNPLNNTVYSEDGELIFLRCSACGLIWRSPDSMEISGVYSPAYFDSKNYLHKRKHKVKKSGWLLDIAGHLHPAIGKMLEVGCSVGNTLEAAAHRKIESLGIDISDYAVDYCVEKGLNAENKSLRELLSNGQKFDLIFMQHVLEHFPDPFAVLRNCYHLLEERGVILIMVPNSRFRPAERKRGRHRFYNMNGVGAEHYVYFDYDNLSNNLETCGFEVVQKNYPVRVKGSDNPLFFLNRIGRRSLALFGADQELLVVARKK